jgi:demethylmenaquinone methyltransferase / 2-methoxy-6-polyprenyl-1,4-benzoquinol methylase
MSASRPPAAIDTSKDPPRIAAMFDAIARRYDFLNHLLSGGLDRYWRRRALAALRLTGRETLLDVCTGTADVAIGAMRRRPPARRAIGVDFAPIMLARGRVKVMAAGLDGPIALVRGDAMRLPVKDASVDAITIAFGIRNVADVECVCAEIWRALVPRGRLAILEFSMPRTPVVRSLYAWYFRRVLPLVGRAVSGHAAAYAYLPASVGTFSTPRELVDFLERAGFVRAAAIPLTFGAVQLYLAEKPANSAPGTKNHISAARRPGEPVGIIV